MRRMRSSAVPVESAGMPPHDANANSVQSPSTRSHVIGTLESIAPGMRSRGADINRAVGSASCCAAGAADSRLQRHTARSGGAPRSTGKLYPASAARATYVVYARSDANIARLVTALAPLHPYLRGAPAGLPFQLDADTIRRGLNFTLTTDLGDLDVLGEIVGGGRFDDLVADTEEIALQGHRVRLLTLERLIATKRAAGRPRDHDALAELEVLLEERRRA